jgi:hypothetical protein
MNPAQRSYSWRMVTMRDDSTQGPVKARVLLGAVRRGQQRQTDTGGDGPAAG